MPFKSVRRVGVGAVLLLLVTTGCVGRVGGHPHPAPGITPRPLVGDAVQQVLLNEAELSKALAQPVKSDADSPPRFGGADQLFDMHSSPRECAGVVFEMQRSAYGSATLKNLGRETWWNASGYHAKVISVIEVVVALAKARDADALFADFSSQWQRCDGTTVTEYSTSGERFLTADISDVRSANSVLSATVQKRIITPVIHARALGVRVNCLVEDDVAYFAKRPDNSAVNIAHRMMDKVSGLT